MYKISNSGWIEVITGPMYCGKSEELIRRLRRVSFADQQIRVFKPALDNRFSEENLVSHNGARFEAVPVDHPGEIISRLDEGVEVVGIDEIQFFPGKIIEICEKLAGQDTRVITAGLDRDFRGEPFGPVPELMARAEYVDKLHAICVQCGEPASRTQRLIDGEPARYDDPVIMVGADEVYEARCRSCHEVSG